MFPRQRRITQTKDILEVLLRGNRAQTGVLSCSFLPKPSTLNKVVVIVSTAVSKRAVVRNRIKRRLRALLIQKDLPDGNLVVRVKKGADQLDFTQLAANLEKCLNRLFHL